MLSAQALPMTGDARETVVLGSGKTSVKAAVRAAIYAALFLIAMEVAASLARFGANVTPVWIASAILVWALLSAPTRDWVLYIGFASIAHVARAIYLGDNPANEAIYFTANIGGPLLCASLLRWAGVTLKFEERGEVFRFLALAGIVAPTATTAVVAIGTLYSPDRFVIGDLGTWFLSDALSYVVFVPIFCSVSTGAWRSLLEDRVRPKAALMFAILIGLHAAAWVMTPLQHNFFTIALVPYLVLMAFELGSAGAGLAIAVTAIGLLGNGMLVPREPGAFLDTSLYLLASQFYIAATATCLLPLAAALEEKKRLYEKASEALGEAQAAWGSLIAAEAHYRLVADNSRDMIMRLDLNGAIVFASPACSLISVKVHDLEGRRLDELVHGEDRARIHAEIDAFVAASELDRPRTTRARLREADGSWKTFDIVSTLVASRGREPEEIIAVLREVHA
jgi:PAS domain S-box-containing protein